MGLRYTNQTAPHRWIAPPAEELAPNGLPVTPPNGFSRRQIAAAVSPQIQELILVPTEKCNCRRTYCYQDFELGATLEAIWRPIKPHGMNQLRTSEFFVVTLGPGKGGRSHPIV
jgi:hypothetical protein